MVDKKGEIVNNIITGWQFARLSDTLRNRSGSYLSRLEPLFIMYKIKKSIIRLKLSSSIRRPPFVKPFDRNRSINCCVEGFLKKVSFTLQDLFYTKSHSLSISSITSPFLTLNAISTISAVISSSPTVIGIKDFATPQ